MVKNDGISEKLQRFLMTTARRESINETRVAAVIIKDGRVLIDEGNTVPSIPVADWNLKAALNKLANELRLSEYKTVYLGYVDFRTDSTRVRQYHFKIDALKIRPIHAMRLVRMDELDRAEAAIIASALKRGTN